MPWLRIDDGFTEHEKVVSLKRADRWTWLEVLGYCARRGNAGRFSMGICEVLRWVTPAFLDRCVQAGLLERVSGSPGTDRELLQVHDWMVYNGGTVADRVDAYLEKNPTASANEVYRAIGGKRAVVLAEMAQRSGSAGSPTGSVTGSPRAGARSPSPSPTKEPRSSSIHQASSKTSSVADVGVLSELIDLSPSSRQLARWTEALESDPDRVRACLDAARSGNKPAALLDDLLKRGEHPGKGTEPAKPLPPLIDSLETWIRNAGHLCSDDSIRDEIANREEKRGEQLTKAERKRLMKLANDLREPEPSLEDEPKAAA